MVWKALRAVALTDKPVRLRATPRTTRLLVLWRQGKFHCLCWTRIHGNCNIGNILRYSMVAEPEMKTNVTFCSLTTTSTPMPMPTPQAICHAHPA